MIIMMIISDINLINIGDSFVEIIEEIAFDIVNILFMIVVCKSDIIIDMDQFPTFLEILNSGTPLYLFIIKNKHILHHFLHPLLLFLLIAYRVVLIITVILLN
jgi:hypothetical protein